MQKLAGLITENQYKGTLTEVESDLITLLYSLRNSINNDDKEQSMGVINQLLSIARDMEDAQLTEIEEDEDDIPLTKDVKRYIDGQIKNAKKLRKPEKLKKYLTNPAVLGSSSFLHLILLAFEDKYPDAIDVTDEVKKYILSQISEDQINEIEGDPDDYYGYNEPIDPNDYADDNEDSENQLADIIEDNKAALAKQFNLVDPMVSWNAEGEPVIMTDDNDEQVDFIKVEDWENNKGFYNRNDGVGKITLDGIDIIYVINPFG